MNYDMCLILDDGSEWRGWSFGHASTACGECVFQTGMTGYASSLSDPSYIGQLLVMSFPLIGNYGVPDWPAVDLPVSEAIKRPFESRCVQVAGLAVGQYYGDDVHSHWRAVHSLGSYLRYHKIPAIHGLDTRAIITRIRESQVTRGMIRLLAEPLPPLATSRLVEPDPRAGLPRPEIPYHRPPHVRDVSTSQTYDLVPSPDDLLEAYAGLPRRRILIVDYGVKFSILRALLNRNFCCVVVPWNAKWVDLLEAAAPISGVVLTNGPGDPADLTPAISQIRRFLETRDATMQRLPLFGICLGHQLLALASGAETHKLPAAHRGHNHPVVDCRTGACYITSQNHGFGVDPATISAPWEPWFVNANDQTNEGIIHPSRPVYSVQFHPEGHAGPLDCVWMFDMFAADVRGMSRPVISPRPTLPLPRPPSTVLLLGSGGLSIGQAGEFDYAGSQAIKALREDNVDVILVNPNVATVQSTPQLASKVYFLPILAGAVERIIEAERPDGILLQFGGQSALNCGIELTRRGVLDRYGVRVLGTSVQAILETEDRAAFSKRLRRMGSIPIAPSASVAAGDTQAALDAAAQIGYPVLVRMNFALGGLGSAFAASDQELMEVVREVSAILGSTASIATASSSATPGGDVAIGEPGHDTGQTNPDAGAPESQPPLSLLIEKSLFGWKEIEFEVVRDAYDHAVAVCAMENVDPLGVHTGESIVVAPPLTMDDRDYFGLRETALAIVRDLEIVGECNVQFALDPASSAFYVVEVNARLSRSSALASKATGYPLAFIAAKLALGADLVALRNPLTGSTTACFEPSLDYVVVKMPRWDLAKFPAANRSVGTSMKSVGEVMAIAHTFEDGMQRAIRMVAPGSAVGFEATEDVRRLMEDDGGVESGPAATESPLLHATGVLRSYLATPSDRRIFAIAYALEHGVVVSEIAALTRIDSFYLYRLAHIVAIRATLREGGGPALPPGLLLHAKRHGFSDAQIALLARSTPAIVRSQRIAASIVPVSKVIDTAAAEFRTAVTLKIHYLTYHGVVDESSPAPAIGGANLSLETVPTVVPAVVILGGGAYSIGSSIEFDCCAVECLNTCRALGYRGVMVNCNPETVSTDADQCDRLYVEEIGLERVLDVVAREPGLRGVVLAMGGQTPNNLATQLSRASVAILGTAPAMIEEAENRFKFSRLLDQIGVQQPPWRECRRLAETLAFCHAAGYPCLIRPSYVLSGTGMAVVRNDAQTKAAFAAALQGRDVPVVISKFVEGALEVDVDAVVDHGRVVVQATLEHVQHAGVHSGDATLVCPPEKLSVASRDKIHAVVQAIAASLRVVGPMNVQFLVPPGGDREPLVIECNLRASRSFPFASKALRVDLVAAATEIMLGTAPPERRRPLVAATAPRGVAVKVSQFSFARLSGADPALGVEMASTGEVAGFGHTFAEAFYKATAAAGFDWSAIRYRAAVFSARAENDRRELFPVAQQLVREAGFRIYCTPGTAAFFRHLDPDLDLHLVAWDKGIVNDDNGAPPALLLHQILLQGRLSFVIILPNREGLTLPRPTRGYTARRLAADLGLPFIYDAQTAQRVAQVVRLIFSAQRPVDRSAHDLPLSDLDARAHRTFARLPGLYDVHVHVRDPGQTHKEDWDSATAAALAGGVTFIGAMPNTEPAVIDADTFARADAAASAAARCDYGLYLGVAPGPGPGTAPARSADVLATKLYLSPTNCRGLHLTALEDLVRAFAPPHDVSAPLAVHAEGLALAAALQLAAHHRRALHVCHLSRAAELELVQRARASGLRVTCEVTPHHLFLYRRGGRVYFRDPAAHTRDEDPILATPDAFLTVAPPIAELADVEALWRGLATDDVDIIASDHAPHRPDEKAAAAPPPGFPGLETMLPLLLTAVAAGALTLAQVVDKTVTGPRRVFNLPAQPDTWVEVDLGEAWVIRARDLKSRAAWTPFEGVRVVGRVRRLLFRGTLVVRRRSSPDGGPRPPMTSGQRLVGEIAGSRPAAEPRRRRRISDKELPEAPPGTSGVAVTGSVAAASIAAAATLTHVLRVADFSRTSLHQTFALAAKLKGLAASGAALPKLLADKILVTLFYEPSTRTHTSFQAAALRLGAQVIALDAQHSSIAKGESLEDTVRTVSHYADAIVIRHGLVGAAARAAAVAGVPVINGGDGTGEHPTQALLDAFTIREERGTINNLRYTFVGDLRHGRTVHSLALLLANYHHLVITYCAPDDLQIPDAIYHAVAENPTVRQTRVHVLDQRLLADTDVLYLTRLQTERLDAVTQRTAAATFGDYALTPDMLTHAPHNLVIMHPLPRLREIDPAIDHDARAAYFRQAKNGVYVRMALLLLALGAYRTLMEG